MNAETIAILVGIVVISISGFVYLATVMVENWRSTEGSKGSVFNILDKRRYSGRVEPHRTLFQTCMAKYGWDLDHAAFCASRHKA
jgi:hypothetical protein